MNDLGFQVQVIPAWLVRVLPFMSRAFVFWGFRSRPTIYISHNRVSDPLWMSLTLAHEQVHVRQWAKLGRWGFIRSYITRKGRLAAEAEAYAASVRWYYGGHWRFNPATYNPLRKKAISLATRYGLGISVVTAMEAIESWL